MQKWFWNNFFILENSINLDGKVGLLIITAAPFEVKYFCAELWNESKQQQ